MKLKLQKAFFILYLLIFYTSGVFAIIPAPSFLHPDTLISIDSSKINNNINSGLKDSVSTVKQKKKEAVLKSKVVYHATDSMVLNVKTGEIYLYNKAKATYDKIQLEADFIKFNQKENTLYAKGVADSLGTVTGKPVFQENDDKYNCDEIAYNFKTKKGKIREISTAEGQGFLLGEQVKKNEKDELFIKSGKYTTCNLGHPHFYIGVTKAKKAGKYIVSGPAYLVIEDIPLPVAVPFGFFPSKNGRSSGILLPNIGEDTKLGFFLKDGGYYWGINDNMDLTLRGAVYSKGSYSFNINDGYYTRYKYKGNVNFSFSNRLLGEPESPGFQKNRDFNIRWSHNQDTRGTGSTFSASVNAGTSKFYQNNSGYSLANFTQNNLRSSISYSKSWKGTPLSIHSSLQHSQDLQTGIVNLTLPDFSFNMARINPLDRKNRTGTQKWFQKIGLSYTMTARNQVSQKDSLLFDKQTLYKFQNGIQHNIPISTSFNILKYINISPSINYTERWYLQHIEKKYFPTLNNPSRTINDTVSGFGAARDYSFSTSASTRLYGMYNIRKFGIVAIRHVINPSVSFGYRPDFGEAQYGYYRTVKTGDNKYSKYSIYEQGIFGSPGAGKSSVISFGLGNNLEMKVKSKKDTVSGTKKIKLLESFSIASSYNLFADSLKLAPFSFNARTTLFDKANINFNALYDPYVYIRQADGGILRINQFELNKNNRLAHLNSMSLSLGTSLNSQVFRGKSSASARKYTKEEMDLIGNPQAYLDFNIPWSLTFNYSLNYLPLSLSNKIVQTLNFNGDFNLTPKWKVTFYSGYDFLAEKFTTTSLSIYRDLHCWDMAIRWIPFGQLQSYNVDLKVKASILQDLKLTRRREYYER